MSSAPAHPTADCLKPFGTTIFAEMTGLANAHDAVNLSQGFPDFEGPALIRAAAQAALADGHNQYARSRGVVPLVEAIAAHQKTLYGIELNPLNEVVVTCGATEGIMSTMLGLLNPGDEVVLIEPYYDSYPVAAARAGATVKYLTLREPDFSLDVDALAALITDNTRLLVLNSPHNPTGKVFTVDELDAIAQLCIDHDVTVLSDEVYEHLTYDMPHVPISSRPGMFERTVTLSSIGKTFSFTGWKVGWASGPARLINAVQSAHQFITYAVATPLQHGAAFALRHALESDFLAVFKSEYRARRDVLVQTLRESGFAPLVPDGTYFVLADFSALSTEDDRTFAKTLIQRAGVAAIPPSVFYAQDKAAARHLLRFAFCKTDATLAEAKRRLAQLAP